MAVQDALESPGWVRDPGRGWAVSRLDSLTGIDDVRTSDSLRDCRSEAHEWLLLNLRTGEVAYPRCKATNRCSYCRELGARETAEMVLLAADEAPPEVYVVLTCREHVTRQQLRRDLCQLRRVARRYWSGFEYFCALEWQRRGAIHVNLLVRGVARGAADLLLRVLFRVWRRRHTAVLPAQHASPIASERHCARYVLKLARYIAKPDQSAPAGWGGHRSSQTRGFLPRSAAEMRSEARESLAYKAAAARYRSAGLSVVEAAWKAAEDLEMARSDEWVLYAPMESAPSGSSMERRPVPTSVAGDRRLGRAELVAAHEHIDVSAVVRGQRLARIEDDPALQMVIPAIGRAGAEEVGRLVDGGSARVVHQCGCLGKDRVRVESCDVPHNDDRSRWRCDGARCSGVNRKQLAAVERCHVWTPLLL